MTLLELANYICTKAGQTDEDSLTAAKAFLGARLRMLWDAAAWRESLCLVSSTAAAQNPWVILPVEIERVLKVRAGASATLPPFEAAAVFDYAPSVFEEAGEPAGFMVFPPVVLGPPATLNNSFVSFDRDEASIQDDDGKLATIELETASGARLVRTLPNQLGVGWLVLESALFVVRFEKEVTRGNYSVQFGAGITTGIFPGAVTHYPRRQRIRLMQVPPQALPILALCKRACPAWANDYETTPLANAENALAAFAMADLLERQRQYGKAQLKMQEGEAQLKIMHDLEGNQSASEQRILPVDLHGLSYAGYDRFGAGGKEVW